MSGDSVWPIEGTAERAVGSDAPPELDSEAAFHAFYLRQAPALSSYLRRVTGNPGLAEELLQETFCRFLEARPSSPTEAARRAYLYRTATNLFRDYWRRRGREIPLETDPAGREGDRELSLDVWGKFTCLKPTDRALLWLAYVEGCDHCEIASRLGMAIISVRVRLFRARRRFAGLLTGEGTK